MREPTEHDLRPRLNRGWRRTLVCVTAVCATTISLIHLLAPQRAGLKFAAAAGLGFLVMSSVWLLADALWPWLAREESVPAEERAHADATLRRSYGFLFGLAMAALLYLHLAERRPSMVPDAPHHATVILWTFVALVVLLPVLISAWTEPEEGFGRPVGPLGVLRARFGGRSAALHIAGAALLATAIPVLLVGAGVFGSGASRLAHTVVLFGFLAVLGAGLVLLRAVLAERGRGAARRRL